MNWETFGVEVSKTAVENAKNFGFNVFHGELHEANYSANFFDVIIASEILEHLYDPRKLVREVYRILRPGGLFWATTPSSRGLSSLLSGRELEFYFSSRTFTAFFRKSD